MICQLLLDLVLVLLMLFFIKNIRSSMKAASTDAVVQVQEIVRPALEDAASVAETFDRQIREKQRLVRELNEKLDDRTHELNLFLVRVEAQIAQASSRQGHDSSKIVMAPWDRQQMILELFDKGFGAEDISGKLSLPKAEVDLVLKLKKKLLEMEESL